MIVQELAHMTLHVETAKFQKGIGQCSPTQQSQHRFIYLVGHPEESFDISTDEAPMGDIAAPVHSFLSPIVAL